MQGKEKAKQIKEVRTQFQELQEIKKKMGIATYKQKRTDITNQLKIKRKLFKEERIAKKLKVFGENLSKPHVPNAMEQRQGYHVTPFMKGKIQFGKMFKEKNFKQVRRELNSRGVAFDLTDSWKKYLPSSRNTKEIKSTSNL